MRHRRCHRPLLGLVVLLPLALTACQPTASDSVPAAAVALDGTLHSTTGHLPPLAHARLKALAAAEAEPQTVTVENGSFHFDLKAGDLYELEVTAVDHRSFSTPIVLDRAAAVSVTLAANELVDPIDEVKIFGSWNGGSPRETEAMERHDDGTFVHVVESEDEQVKYQLANVTTAGNTVNGTRSDDYEYDGGGDYWSIVGTVDGRAEIVFDPTLVPRGGGAARVESDDPVLAGILDLRGEAEAVRADVRAKSKAGEEVDQDAAYAAIHQRSLELVDDEATPEPVRRFAAYQALELPIDLGDEETARLVGLLGPTSPFWSLKPYLVAMLDADDHGELLEKMRAEHSHTQVRGLALANLTEQAKGDGDDERWRSLYAELAEKYAEDRYLDYYVAKLNPESPIQAGKPAPDFAMSLIDGTVDGATEVTTASFEGQYVLVDFWATWCGPCIAEMPKMHEAWNRYGGNGKLRFLSVSFDGSVDDIAPFRKDKWAMPWLHGFLESGFESDVAKAYEVEGIPKPILIGPDGRIVAVDDPLRGDELLPTLEGIFGDHT